MPYRLLQKQVLENPGGVAIVHDERSVTYAEFDRAIQHTVSGLRELYSGGVVATCLDNSIYNLQTLYAGALLSAPICTLDPTQTVHELGQILDDCKASLILTQREHAPKLRAAAQSTGARVVSDEVHGAVPPGGAVPSAASPDADFLIQYTSGSTGRPKGVVQSQRGMTSRLEHWNSTVGIDASCSHLCILPLSHGYGNYCVALPALSSGGALHLMNLKKVTPKSVARYLEARRLTCFYALPFFYRLMAELPASFEVDLSGLRSSMVGSAPVTPEVLELFHARFGVKLNNCYGTSEAGIITYNPNVEEDVPAVSIGRLIHGIEHRLEGSYDVDGVQASILAVATTAMAERYFSADAGSVATDGWHRTGDLVRQDAKGYFYVAGRLTQFINVSGNKVMPEEIEAAILRLTQVAEVAVTSVPDAFSGEKIAALVVKKGELSSADVAAHCRQHLVGYKVPAVIKFVDALPRSAVGKIQRGKLVQYV